ARTTVLRSADELDRLAVVRTEHAARLEALPARRLVADERVAACRAAEARLPQARTLMIDLGRRLSQFAVAEELEFQVSDAQRKRDEQHLVTVALREELLDLRERRLQGMAAELASAMAVGADCPVCGSHDHPHPAVPSPGSPSKADEQQVRARLDDAEVDLLSHDDHMRGYRARLLVVREALGAGTSDETLAELEAARLDAEGCAADAATLGSAQTDLLTVADEERAEHDALARLEAHVARLTERRDLAERTVASLSAELQELLGSPGGANDVSDLAATSSRAARVLTEARDALVAESRLREAADEASSRAAETAVAQGFADLGTAQSAMLSDDAVDDLAERVATRGEAETACRLVLDDPEVVAAASAPRVDLDQVHAAREQATRDHGSAVARARSAEATLKRLMELDAALSAALAAWEPVRRDHALVRSLSEFAEGKGAHNTRQMRLSAYVLAARLGQVVAAANERLVKMSDDRYTLEHTAERGVGERRGGLSLRVRDQWTDETRDPVTLSGGETFVVSLALALGLADVVTAEAGGARVDTLFVDEGFGSLDADTLELVMDTLDQLRAGGRVVGLVSHVPELRSRIPAQLQVLKTRHGSALVQQVSATR
ncbi:MAG: family ATPase, partial [Nocardioidaceae bacterium]|nr:family ATPase [Nocardioidaceae bacterium]